MRGLMILIAASIGSANAQDYEALVLPMAPGQARTLGAGAGDTYYSGYGTPPGEDDPARMRALLFDASVFVDVTPPGFAGALINDSRGAQHVGGASLLGGYPSHAYLWQDGAKPIDLHPPGFSVSEALGAGGNEQAGYVVKSFECRECGLLVHKHAARWQGSPQSMVLLHSQVHEDTAAYGTDGVHYVGRGEDAHGQSHALLWTATGALATDLNPPGGYDLSLAAAVDGGQQVGFVSGTATGGAAHAALWTGSAASFTDLNPDGFVQSNAYSVRDGIQVGCGSPSSASWTQRALAWTGSAETVLDLHALLPAEFQTWNSSAADVDTQGRIVGFVEHGGDWQPVLWVKRPAPRAPTTSSEAARGP